MSEPFDAVVLSGGGEKGILELGALHYYHEKGLYIPEKIKEYAGASIGAAISLLLICGYIPMDIFSEIYGIDNFFGVNSQSIWDIFKYMGLMSIDGFIQNIERLVERKVGFIPTLSRLKEITGKTLTVSAVNVSNMVQEKYGPYTHPNLSAINAVKISCNLPILFQCLKYNNLFMADGGILNNFPWDYISNNCKNVLGVAVLGTDVSTPVGTFFGYFYRLITLPINGQTDLRCQMAPENVKVIRIEWEKSSTGGGILQFHIPPEVKMEMFLEGYRKAEREDRSIYLKIEGWDFDLKEEANISRNTSYTNRIFDYSDDEDDGWVWE